MQKLQFLSAIFCILFFWTGKPLHASAGVISGRVCDAESRQPLPFANIGVRGQYTGTVSNSEGVYVLDQSAIGEYDTIVFSYMGYHSKLISAGQLMSNPDVYLQPAAINLDEVAISSKTMNARQIIREVQRRYKVNHPDKSLKQHVFFHNYEQFPWPGSDQLILKHSDMTGLDPATFNDLMGMIPKEVITYQDVLLNVYQHDGEQKILPDDGISLLEGSYKTIFEEMESRLDDLFNEVQETREDPDVYYKIRSGILSFKDDGEDSSDTLWKAARNDPEHEYIESQVINQSLKSWLETFTGIKSKGWDFIDSPGKYRYTKQGVTTFEGEWIYKISFSPMERGLYEGTVYISSKSFAILEIDFAFADGKQSEHFNLLGFGHTLNFRRGRVLYEKSSDGYYLKYIYGEQNETIRIDRKLHIMKKKKQFLNDRTLEEMVMDIQASFDVSTMREVLIISREEISDSEFDNISQPPLIKLRKEYSWSSDIWNDRTVIAPTAELQKIKRKE